MHHLHWHGGLLLWPTLAMQRDAAYRERWSGRFDCLAADEYQDVNLAQYTWLKLLSARHREIFVVGDDDQSVYSWRGADVTFIRRFTEDFVGAAQFRLEENFRSTGHILAAANVVIGQDDSRLGKHLFTRQVDGDRIEIVACRNAETEAVGIAAEIKRRHGEGLAWSDMALAYRGNALSRQYEEALLHARIPYVLVGDVGFWQRSGIKDALALLRLCATPDDVQADEAFRRVINVPARGFGDRAIEEVAAEAAFRNGSLFAALETANLTPKTRAAGLVFVDAIRRVAKDATATVADQISMLIDATGYRAMLRESKAETNEGRLDNILELIHLAGDFHTSRELLDHAALATGRSDEDATDRVRLMTLHKAKGLEFIQVFLVAWEEGVFPSTYGDLAEERRLAYIALTRGMRRVTISYADFRRGHTAPSRFIAHIPDEHRVIGWLRGPTEFTGPAGVTVRVDPRAAALLRRR